MKDPRELKSVELALLNGLEATSMHASLSQWANAKDAEIAALLGALEVIADCAGLDREYARMVARHALKAHQGGEGEG